MKSVHVGHSNLLRAPATSHSYCRTRNVDATKGQAITDAVLLAIAAAILALYAAIVVGLYRWSRYDPLLPSATAAVAQASTLMRVVADHAVLGNTLPGVLKIIAPSLNSIRAAVFL
jgi:hypothetical protein